MKSKKTGDTVYRPGKTTFKQHKIKDVLHGGQMEEVQTPAIMQNMVRYSEKAKAVFLVTPPHLIRGICQMLNLSNACIVIGFFTWKTPKNGLQCILSRPQRSCRVGCGL